MPRPAPDTLRSDAGVHRLFELQAANSPDAVAVICGERVWTYRELNAHANRIARHLARQGCARQELIGIGMRRSPEMVAALLGVWKAGCAYVPLDPAYPAERLAFVLRDAGMRLLLVDAASRPSFDGVLAGSAARALCLAGDEATASGDAVANPDGVSAPDDIAYVMYTSGSTGQPKGAMVTHGGLGNYLCWAVDAYAVGAGDSVAVHSPLPFDLTVTSLHVPLLAGAQVELLEETDGAEALVAALRARRRRLVKLTPAHLEILNQELDPAELAGVADVLVIGGENLAAERVAPWRRHAPATRLINEYGPTETVVGCCFYEVRPDDPWHGSVPIGRPITNMRLHVLDEALRPAAPGVAGELYIGGPGVARGYLNRAQLTAERFVADPFADEPDARLYRSGDVVRWRQEGDGVLEYLGRQDDQVKIHGHRVELGEVEQALAGHPDVLCAAAVLDPGGAAELAAFAVARRDAVLSPPQLLEFMRRRLPHFMVPARCILLSALPLSLHGKVDRKALAGMAAAAAQSAGTPVPLAIVARTPTEELVAQAFREVFLRNDIGIFDNFFDIGGSSMAALRLMAALRAATGTRLPLRHLYEHPSIAALAQAIDALHWSATADAAVAPRDPDGERMGFSF